MRPLLSHWRSCLLLCSQRHRKRIEMYLVFPWRGPRRGSSTAALLVRGRGTRRDGGACAAPNWRRAMEAMAAAPWFLYTVNLASTWNCWLTLDHHLCNGRRELVCRITMCHNVSSFSNAYILSILRINQESFIELVNLLFQYSILNK